MGRAIVIEIRLLQQQWHGVGDWPPSPFRLFQALIAGAYGGRWRAEDNSKKDAAFRWLESLQPPIIVAPPKYDLRAVPYFVPNNDADGFGNDPRRLERVAKSSASVRIDAEPYFAYLWSFDEGEAEAVRIAGLSKRLHTFGRGIDAAFAQAEIIDAAEIEERLAGYRGGKSRPNASGDGGAIGGTVPCPMGGSLESLKTRFALSARRFSYEGPQGKNKSYFIQPPKAVSRLVAYSLPPSRFLFDLRILGGDHRFYAIPVEKVASVAKCVRNLAYERLKLPSYEAMVEKVIVGRTATGREMLRRVRFTPLPTIGHRYADPSIRRVLLEVPPDSPISASDISWAISGQLLPDFVDVDVETGEVSGVQLVLSTEDSMLRHYGINAAAARLWRSVTPVVLPTPRLRGRANGSARAAFQARAAGAVVDALRHAGVWAAAREIRVQKEPFHLRGSCANAFDSDRFGPGRLHHVEIDFVEPITGPLIVGDGRWLGLGLMRPVRGKMTEVHEEANVETMSQSEDEGSADDLGDGDVDDDE